jgi:hypothetical protein
MRYLKDIIIRDAFYFNIIGEDDPERRSYIHKVYTTGTAENRVDNRYAFFDPVDQDVIIVHDDERFNELLFESRLLRSVGRLIEFIKQNRNYKPKDLVYLINNSSYLKEIIYQVSLIEYQLDKSIVIVPNCDVCSFEDHAYNSLKSLIVGDNYSRDWILTIVNTNHRLARFNLLKLSIEALVTAVLKSDILLDKINDLTN